MRVSPWILAPAAGWGVYAWGSQLLAYAGAWGTIWRGRGAERRVALTFDDGPDPATTPRVLDMLAAARARATFFLIGRRAIARASLARRIADDGHDLGNHSWSHRNLWRLGPAATRQEVQDGHWAVADAAGSSPRFFRPPWGMTNLALFSPLQELGTPCVFWSLQPEGLRAVDPDQQASWALARVRAGDIMGLHDADGVTGAGSRLVAALPRLLDGLRARGYSVVPLRDLL
jgi:peptidoglycan/xylan/chitin deacetylase (PgdA/CDA1 family)